MMKHLQCQLSPTPKNKGFLKKNKKYMDTNTAITAKGVMHNLTIGRNGTFLF